MMRFIFSILLCSFFYSALALAGAAPFANIRERIQDLNLTPYLSHPSERSVTIAVFDLDFTGWDAEKGHTLPLDTEFRPGPHPSQLPASGHGLAMAQLAWAAMSNAGVQSDRPAKVILYQTAGYSQLKWAVQDAIAERADVILYAQVWEFGSNFDGKGFLNVLVDQAIAAGITWVNAAGNYGSLTYNSVVNSKNETIELSCVPSVGDGSNAPIAAGAPAPEPLPADCPLRMVLSWNDFHDDSEVATTKDLDLDLVDVNGVVIGSSHLRQVGTPAPGETASKYAREMIELSVKPGRYFAHVVKKSGNFLGQDKFRIVVSGDGVLMRDATRDDSVLPPADNINAITASAGDSEIASWSANSGKPDFWTTSRIEIGSGTASGADPHAVFLGSSNSAALIAGSIALMKSIWPEAALTAHGLTVRDLKLADWKSLIDLNSVGRSPGEGVSDKVTGIAPVGGGVCFSARVKVADGKWLPGATATDGSTSVSVWKERGAMWVDSTQGPKLMIANDPLIYFKGLMRTSESDAVMVDGVSGKPAIVARSQVKNAQANGWAELAELPAGKSICGQEAKPWGSDEVANHTNGERSPYFALPPFAAFEAWIQ